MKTLELSTEDFRRLATNVVELCSEYLCTLDGRSTFPRVTGLESERFFNLDLPEHGMGDQAFAALTEVIENSRARTVAFSDMCKAQQSRLQRWATFRLNPEPEYYCLALLASGSDYRAHCGSLAVRSDRLQRFRWDADWRRLRR